MNNDLKAWLIKAEPIVDQIADIFARADLAPAEGEAILAFMLGASLGLRAEKLSTMNELLKAAWEYGAEEG